MKKKWKNEKKNRPLIIQKKVYTSFRAQKEQREKLELLCVRQSRRLKRADDKWRKKFFDGNHKKKWEPWKKVKSQRRNGNFFLSFFFTPMDANERKRQRDEKARGKCKVEWIVMWIKRRKKKRGWKKTECYIQLIVIGAGGGQRRLKKAPKKELNEQRKKKKMGRWIFFRVLCVWKALVGQEEANGYIVYIRQSTSDGGRRREWGTFVCGKSHRNFCGLSFGFTPGKRHFGQENWLKNMVHLSK